MKIQFKFPFSRFIVRENSMLPAYKPGDHVLTFNWGQVKKGDVVVFKSNLSFWGVKRLQNQNKIKTDSGPHFTKVSWGKQARMTPEESVYLIKRIDGIDGDFVYLSADNKQKSGKVWKVARKQIIGRVVLKY